MVRPNALHYFSNCTWIPFEQLKLPERNPAVKAVRRNYRKSITLDQRQSPPLLGWSQQLIAAEQLINYLYSPPASQPAKASSFKLQQSFARPSFVCHFAFLPPFSHHQSQKKSTSKATKQFNSTLFLFSSHFFFPKGVRPTLVLLIFCLVDSRLGGLPYAR